MRWRARVGSSSGFQTRAGPGRRHRIRAHEDLPIIKLTVRRVGKSLGVLLPSAATRALKVKEGDPLFLVEGPDGSRIMAFEPAFERQRKVADKVVKRHRNALRQLSKR